MEFQSVTQRYRVNLVDSESNEEQPVIVELGLEGVQILKDLGGGSTSVVKKYQLQHITRWVMKENKLTLWTKSPSDLEERQIILSSISTHIIREVLDTLTSCCMQLSEIMQSDESGPEGVSQANALAGLAGGAQPKKQSVIPEQEKVEFWRSPDKEGWMWSQGEYVRNWRRRWFIMKDGYLFRFLNSDVDEGTKARGVVDLSKVTDVNDGKQATGKPNTIKLSTPSSHICYICDSETEQVEWMSALDNQIKKIIRLVSGFDEEEKQEQRKKSAPNKAPKKPEVKVQDSSDIKEQDWNKLLAKSYANQDFSSDEKGGGGAHNKQNLNYQEFYSGSTYYPSVDTNLDFSQIQGLNRKPSEENGSFNQDHGSKYQQQNFPNPNYSTSQQYLSTPPPDSFSNHANQDPNLYGHPSVPSYHGTPTYQQNNSYDQNQQYQQQQGLGYGGANQQYSQPQQQIQQQQQQQQQQQPQQFQQGQQYGYQQAPAKGQAYGQEYSIIDQNPQQLQAQWQKAYTGEGRVYYYNLQSGQSQWEPPY